jgi:hypothetical protein
MTLNFAMAFKQAKHNGLAVDIASKLAFDTMSLKVRLTHFYRALKRRILLTKFCQSLTNLKVNRIHRSNRNTKQFCGTAGSKIQDKKTHELPKFSLCNFRAAVISILSTTSATYHSLISAFLPDFPI